MVLTVSTRPEIDEVDIPTALAEAFRRAGNRGDPPETLYEGFADITSVLDEDDVSIELEDMYQSEPTRHAVHIGETVEYVPCVMDAMIVALSLETSPIEIHSTPPNGDEAVQLRVTNDHVTVTPESAVVSFGIGLEEAAESSPEIAKEQLNEPSTIPTTCSVTNAFPNPEAYERWADTVSEAAVMKLSVVELIAMARRAPPN